ncbi:MAG: hypothetical protein AAF846_22525 [Chloroflexota bacterium]
MGKQKRKRNKRLSNREIAIIIALTACLNIIIALGALVLGRWIDAQMAWRGTATVTLLVVSFPLSIFLMVHLALALINRFGSSTNSHVIDDNQSPDKEE